MDGFGACCELQVHLNLGNNCNGLRYLFVTCYKSVVHVPNISLNTTCTSV